MPRFRIAGLLVIAAVTTALSTQAAQPARAAAELIATDRAFAAAAPATNLITALNAMWRDDVILPAPGVGFAEGRVAATAALNRDTLNATSTIRWTPIRAAVSGDGSHGYTLGYIETTRADGAKLPGKYLAYWIRGETGWRVAVYRRIPRPAGDIDTTAIDPLLPARANPPVATDAFVTEARTSLAKAESDFSARATEIGIGPAFEQFGDAEAMHIAGGPTVAGFTRGNVNIGRAVGAGSTEPGSPVIWAADHKTIVAPSGDFGINLGYIRAKEQTPQSRPFPFFTIWRRTDARSPWRYIAE